MSSEPSRQFVVVEFGYEGTDLGPLFALEDELISAIESSGAGVFDGNDMAADGSEGLLYMYGPSADALFEAVRPVLVRATCLRRPVVTLRYGSLLDDEEPREVEIPLLTR